MKTDEGEQKDADAQQTGLKEYKDTLEGHRATVHLLFHELNTDPGAKTKERDFTPIVSKLVRFKDHLMDSPFVVTSLTKDVSTLLVVVKATKQMMRAYKDFARHHRMSQLDSMLPQLKILVPYLQGLGWSVGSHLGSAYVKAIFFEQVRLTNITVALESLTPRP